MRYGTVVLLNGTSSSGKTSIIKALQTRLDEPYLHAGIDTFFRMLPPRYLWGPQWQEVLGDPAQPGPVGQSLISGMHHAIAALSCAGNPVLADHVLIERAWVEECAALFAPLPAYLIGVSCPLSVAEWREQQRNDRAPGQARAHFERVHAHGVYDLTVDTAIADADTCAERIQQFLATGAAPVAFSQLNHQASTLPRTQ
jgi:chloramphenicol 3-O phosphotransferase